MNILFKVLEAIGVFLVAFLVIWLVAMLLLAVPTDPTVWLGALLDKVAVVLAALIAVLWYVTGESWRFRG